jgi:hypothetical protein
MGHAKAGTNKCETDVITSGLMPAPFVVDIDSIVPGWVVREQPLSKGWTEIQGWEIL